MNLVIPGLDVLDIPNSAYHASKAVGHSALVQMMRSPAHYRNYLDAPKTETPTLAFGTAFHAAILEPDLFEETYIAAPKFDRRTKQGKEDAEKWESDNIGKKSLDPDEFANLKRMIANTYAHKKARMYLQNGVKERSIFWTDEDTGIECKIRPDNFILDDAGEILGILDAKSTRDASKEAFRKQISNFGYDLQAAYYTDRVAQALGRPIPFYFLAVENDAPNGVAVYRASDRTLAVGRSKYRASLQLLDWCQRNDHWPSYQPFGDEEEIDLPHWEREFGDYDDE